MFRTLLVLTAVLAAPAYGQTPMQRRVVDDAVNRGAVCNDGTHAIYYIREGVGADADRWHIHLQSGGSCTSSATCAQRWNSSPRRMSSGCNGSPCASNQPWGATLTHDGAFDDRAGKNPAMKDWTHVFIAYCSSDSWIGDALQGFASPPATYPTTTLEFRGNAIVQAVIEDLADPALTGIMPSIANASDVLLSGASAGAAGMRHQLDRVAASLPHAAVSGLSDAAFDLGRPTVVDEVAMTVEVTCGANFDPTSPNPAGPGQVARFNYWGALAGLDESCKAAHPGSPEDCMSTLTLLEGNHLTTPFMVWSNQTDYMPRDDFAAQIANFQSKGFTVTRVPANATLDECFAQSMRENIAAAYAHTTALERAMSPCRSDNIHIGMLNPNPWNVALTEFAPGKGLRYSHMLGYWLNGAPPDAELAIDPTCP